MSFDYVASPTGKEFLESRKFIKVIMGPVGGGKSTVALMDLFERALGQVAFNGVRRTKFLIVRNTSGQLQATVKPLLNTWFVVKGRGKLGQWRLSDGAGVFEMKFKLPDGTVVHSEFVLQPADTPDDVRRLLSLEASAGWLEEMREIDVTIFENIQSRLTRFPSRDDGGVTYPGLIGSTNPPPMGHWLQELISSPPSNASMHVQPPALLDDGSINPDAENLDHLDEQYYPNLMIDKSQAWIDVYLRNKFGAGGFGEPVFKETFKLTWHRSPTTLKHIPATYSPLLVGMDNGLTAAAVVGQQDARARVNILAEAYVPKGQTMGVTTFLDRLLIPMMRAKFPEVAPASYLFVLDPACYHRSQVNEVTIAQEVVGRGFRAIRAATNDPERRIAAVEGLLNRAIDGGPGLRISPECPWILQALDWGYRFKKMKNGEVTATPDKNEWSHIADALQYLCLHYNATINPASAFGQHKAQEVEKRAFTYF